MKILSLNTVGLHLGYLGCYGNEWIATPNFDRLAADGVVFDQHFVHSPEIESSGVSPCDWLALALDRINDRQVDDGVIHLPSVSFAPPWKLPADMADVYTEDDDVESWPDPPAGECRDDELVLRAQDTYAAVVTWFDAQLGEFLSAVASTPGADEMMLVLTSSAGYPLGEHGQLGWSAPCLHEEAVHVPLVIRFSARQHAGARISALTQPADLEAAMAAWAAGEQPDTGLPGLVLGAVEVIRPHAISTWKNAPLASSLRTLEWALIRMGSADTACTRQLYVKPEDRWEVNDVAEQEIEIADEYDAMLSGESSQFSRKS